MNRFRRSVRHRQLKQDAGAAKGEGGREEEERGPAVEGSRPITLVFVEKQGAQMSNGLNQRLSDLEDQLQAAKERIRFVTDELNEVEQAAQNLQTKAEAISEDVTNVEGRISGLQAAVDTANAQIADLEAQLAAVGTSLDFGPLKATLAAVGDSLTASDTALDAATGETPPTE